MDILQIILNYKLWSQTNFYGLKISWLLYCKYFYFFKFRKCYRIWKKVEEDRNIKTIPWGFLLELEYAKLRINSRWNFGSWRVEYNELGFSISDIPNFFNSLVINEMSFRVWEIDFMVNTRDKMSQWFPLDGDSSGI